MSLVPNINDPNRESELKRMKDILKSPEGPDRVKKEFGIDVKEKEQPTSKSIKQPNQ